MQKFDIAICGAGPVGQTLALLLIKRGLKPAQIVLIDAKTAEQASEDKRTIALSYGSQQILHAASAWPVKSTQIHQIHVSRRGHFGRTLIDCADHQVSALGYVARYGDIIKPLNIALNKFLPELTFLRPSTVSSITQTETHAQINVENRDAIEANLVVQAEGGLFNDQVQQTKHHNYQQTALIAHVKTSHPTSNFVATRAYERFTEQGPLALLPQEDGYAIVWCVHPDKATYLLALNDNAFLAQLQLTFGERVGRFNSITPRAAFPLGLNVQTSPPAGRCITIGNAAQTLHPVAGQGLNLGLRDAFELAQHLSRSTDPLSLLHFFQARKNDRHRIIQLTNSMAQIFIGTSNNNLKQTLASASLGFIDLLTPAKHWLAEQMMFGHRN